MAHPVRVLYVDYSIGFGGAIKSLGLTLSRLGGVEPLLLTTQSPELAEQWIPAARTWFFRRIVNYRSVAAMQRWTSRRVPFGWLRWAVLKCVAVGGLAVTAKNLVWLLWLLRRERVELVHLNNGFVPPEVLLATRYLKLPCIVHLREFSRPVRQHWLAPVDHVARVISVSDAVGAGLRESGFEPSRLVTVHDPVDLPRVMAAESARDRIRGQLGVRPEHILVGIFGRVVRWKGQQVFVEAAIAAMQKEPNLRAVIVGDESDGNRAYFDGVRATIAASGMSERFILAGYVSNVEEYYAATDIVVHASIEAEPFGMVVPEGMAAARAVIATDAGGPREIIRNGETGLLVPPGDATRLAQAIHALAVDPELRTRLGARAREDVRARFSVYANARAVARIYGDLDTVEIAAWAAPAEEEATTGAKP